MTTHERFPNVLVKLSREEESMMVVSRRFSEKRIGIIYNWTRHDIVRIKTAEYSDSFHLREGIYGKANKRQSPETIGISCNHRCVSSYPVASEGWV